MLLEFTGTIPIDFLQIFKIVAAKFPSQTLFWRNWGFRDKRFLQISKILQILFLIL